MQPFQKIVSVCSTVLFLTTSCHISEQKTGKGNYEQEIIQADQSMSKTAQQTGFNNAILLFADTGLVKLAEGKLPIIGRNSFKASFDSLRDIRTISWYPVKAESSLSGDLGYSWGNWQYELPDTIFHGNYFTVWKKHADGTWKVVLDGGNNAPAPAEKFMGGKIK